MLFKYSHLSKKLFIYSSVEGPSMLLEELNSDKPCIG